MSKKLLMNNYSADNDEIILCENYSSGQSCYLWQDKMIDWDKYELYIYVDISAITSSSWSSILTIDSTTNIEEWGNNKKLHLYGSLSHLRIQPVMPNINTASFTKDFLLANYNKQRLQIIINKNGVYLEEKLMVSVTSNELLRIVMDSLKTSTTIGFTNSVCIYNKVSLRKYIERGE